MDDRLSLACPIDESIPSELSGWKPMDSERLQSAEQDPLYQVKFRSEL